MLSRTFSQRATLTFGRETMREMPFLPMHLIRNQFTTPSFAQRPFTVVRNNIICFKNNAFNYFDRPNSENLKGKRVFGKRMYPSPISWSCRRFLGFSAGVVAVEGVIVRTKEKKKFASNHRLLCKREDHCRYSCHWL